MGNSSGLHISLFSRQAQACSPHGGAKGSSNMKVYLCLVCYCLTGQSELHGKFRVVAEAVKKRTWILGGVIE